LRVPEINAGRTLESGRQKQQTTRAQESALCFDWKLGKIHGNLVKSTASNGYNVHKTSTPTKAHTQKAVFLIAQNKVRSKVLLSQKICRLHG
jgi:hypothetical protein